jgi:hypothetical protein
MTKIRKTEPEDIRISAGNPCGAVVPRESSPKLFMRNSSIRFDDVISLTEVKDLARTLPPDSKARELMLALNDNETRWIALGQLLLIHKFLWSEFKS